MGKEFLTLGDIQIGKNKFYRHKTPIFWWGCTYQKSISI